jgi:hypothetical protein
VGLPASPLRDRVLENVDIQAENSFTIRNTLSLRLLNVKLNGKIVTPDAARKPQEQSQSEKAG